MAQQVKSPPTTLDTPRGRLCHRSTDTQGWGSRPYVAFPGVFQVHPLTAPFSTPSHWAECGSACQAWRGSRAAGRT